MNRGRKAVTHRAKCDKPDTGERIMAKPEDTARRVKVGDWKQLTVRIPPEVHRALRIRSAEEGRPAAVIVEGLIRAYLVGGQKS